MVRAIKIIASFLIMSVLVSCYSFTGNTLSEDVKTIQVKDFTNSSALVNPSLAQQFSTSIQNQFLRKTTLKGTTENPDLLVEGDITNYSITPTTISSPTNAPGGAIQAAQNKLSITVQVHYENKVNPEKSFDRTYTDEAVFDSNLDINQIEASQTQIVNDRIINKIFNDILNDW